MLKPLCTRFLLTKVGASTDNDPQAIHEQVKPEAIFAGKADSNNALVLPF
jgi:hypothetical protein